MDLSNFGKFPSLRGKTVFVTGGGSGIGAAIVESFVDQGARVAFVDIDEAASKALCDQLRSQYGAAPHFTRCDIADIPALQAVIDKVPTKNVVLCAMGDLLPFPKKHIVNFVVRNVKKMVPTFELPGDLPLGWHVLRRNRQARLWLSVLAVPLFLAGLVTGGFLSSMVAVAVGH